LTACGAAAPATPPAQAAPSAQTAPPAPSAPPASDSAAEAPPPAAPVASADASAAPAAAAPSIDEKKLDALQLTVAEGWTKEYSADSDCVLLEGPGSADVPPGIARLCRAKEVPSPTGKGFVAYKQKHEMWDKGVTADMVGKKEDWPDGFAATYRVRSVVDRAHPTLAFLAVWRVGGVLLECDGRSVGNEKIRDQIKAMCRSASW
jgi:hypothetical protein